MDMLQQAEVEVDNLTHIHRLYDAKIQVNGRMDYEGAGTGLTSTKTERNGLCDSTSWR